MQRSRIAQTVDFDSKNKVGGLILRLMKHLQ